MTKEIRIRPVIVVMVVYGRGTRASARSAPTSSTSPRRSRKPRQKSGHQKAGGTRSSCSTQ